MNIDEFHVEFKAQLEEDMEKFKELWNRNVREGNDHYPELLDFEDWQEQFECFLEYYLENK